MVHGGLVEESDAALKGLRVAHRRLVEGSDEDIATEEQNMFLEQIRKGDAAAEEGNWKMAAHHFNVATAIDPESTMAFDKLSQANEKAGE